MLDANEMQNFMRR